MANETVLVIDDDFKLQDLLREYLEGYGFSVHTLPDGNSACRAVAGIAPDLVILDVMMPGKDGMEVLRDIRVESRVPVIMLTAKGEDMDRVVGLELGADDYLPKPFNPRELLARIRAVLRRSAGDDRQDKPDDTVLAAGLSLDTVRRVLEIGGERMVLQPTEAKLLAEFLRTPDTPLSRDELMDRVWGRSFSAYDRSIDVHISKLRNVFKSFPEHADRIQTVWGVGYLFRSGI